MKKQYWILGFVIAVLVAAISIVPAGAVQQQPSSTEDYIGNYNFRLEIDGVDAGQFTSVDGLSIEQEVIEYQNGDDPLTRKRLGRVSHGEITLIKDYASNSVLNDWIEAARCGSGDYTRKNMSIILYEGSQDSPATEIKRWNCFECFPKSWKISSMDAKGNDVLTEEVVIVIEWFEEA